MEISNFITYLGFCGYLTLIQSELVFSQLSMTRLPYTEPSSLQIQCNVFEFGTTDIVLA